jgi:hypothetical protein
LLQDPNNIYFKKDYSALYIGNPWNRRISGDENYFLFQFFKYISYAVDYVKGNPINFDKFGNMEAPTTNLRYFSNYYNLISSIIFIVLIYILLKVVFRLCLK